MNMPFENGTATQIGREQIDRDDEINLIDLWHNLLDFKWTMVIVALLCTLGGIGYAVVTTPIYSSDVLLQVETKKTGGLAALDDVSGVLGGSGSNVTGELEIIKSRSVIESVTESMGLSQTISAQYFPYVGRFLARGGDGTLRPAKFGLTQYAWGGEKLKLAQFSVPEGYEDQGFTLIAGELGSYTLLSPEELNLGSGKVGELFEFTIDGRQGKLLMSELIANPGLRATVVKRHPLSLHASLVGNLSASEVGRNSAMIRVSFENPNPSFAVEFLNNVANAYLRQNVERKGLEAEQQLLFLDAQLPGIKEQLRDAENKLNRFIQREGTIDPTLETTRLLQTDVALESRKLELQLQRRQLLQRFQPGHPSIQAIDDQLTGLQSNKQQVAGQTKELPETQREYLRLRRDVEVNQALYTGLLNSSQQLKVAKAGTVGNVAIVDYAVKPRLPIKPKKSQIVVLAALTGLFLGVLAAQALAMLRSSVRDPAKLENATGLSTFAIVPLSNNQREAEKTLKRRTDKVGLLSLTVPNDPSVEALRSFRTGLQFAMLEATNRRVLITGPVPEIGKSFVSANFASILAQAGKKVLLIDGDLRKGTLSRYFIDEPSGGKKRKGKPGLSDVISGQVQFEDALITSEQDNLHVLISGTVPPNPSELLLNPNLSALLAKADNAYDYVIIDSPPVLLVGDASVLASQCAATFIVARYNATNVRQITDCQKRLGQAGVKVTGLIFNGFLAQRSGYYYGYGYGSKYAYGTYGGIEKRAKT